MKQDSATIISSLKYSHTQIKLLLAHKMRGKSIKLKLQWILNWAKGGGPPTVHTERMDLHSDNFPILSLSSFEHF